MKNYPQRGKVYTFNQMSKLDLDDSPNLRVLIEGKRYPIQTAHVTDKDLIQNCPAFAESLWSYEKTTREWIPVFNYAGKQEDLEKIIDYRPSTCTFEPGGYWVTPKGSPRKQYEEYEEGE